MTEKIKLLREYFENQGYSQESIAKIVGVDKAHINKLLNGKKEFGKQTAKKWSDLFGLSYSFLLTGEGEMLNSSPVDSAPASGEGPAEGLPLIPVDAMAGALSGASYDPISRYDCEDIYNVPVFRGAEFLIRVQGDSMQPKYMSGDIIACRRVSLDRLWFQWGKAYVLDTQQGAILKRIEPSRKKGCISACSENPKYKPFDISVDDINGIAIVLGTIRAE